MATERERGDGAVPQPGSMARPTAPGRFVWPPQRVVRRGPFAPPLVLEAMGTDPPVRRLRRTDGSAVWVVTGCAAARDALADPRLSAQMFPRPACATGRDGRQRRYPVPPPGAFMAMDAPEHRRYRSLLAGAFSPRRVQRLAPRIQQLAALHVAAMLAAGPPADLVTALAGPLPARVMCELLGIPHAEYDEVRRHLETLLGLASDGERVLHARGELDTFVRRYVAARRRAPRGDLISFLLHRTGTALTEDEVAGMVGLLLTAGDADPARMIALAVFTLLAHPDRWGALRTEPALPAGAVDELLRHQTLAHLGVSRVTRQPVRLAGLGVPADETVLVALPVANRDPACWDDPAVLDLTRRRHPHLAFGHGPHQCLGQHLARLELTITLTQLLRRLPNLRLAAEVADVPLFDDTTLHGVRALPVTWDPPPSPARLA